MALSRSNQFDDGTVLTESKLEGEFDNIYNNALSLISPLTGNLAVGDFDLTGIGELAFTTEGDASAVGRLRRNGNNITWHDRTGAVPLQMLVGGGIFGLTITNDATDAANDISVAIGAAVDSTENRVIRFGTALIKQLDAAWAVGTNAGMLDTGAIANTTYHIHLIHRSDTGVSDYLASTSATAPTMPTSYDYRRRIGSILRESATIIAFTQDGDYFRRSASVLDVDSTNPGVAAVTRTLSVPTGVNVFAILNMYLQPAGATSGTQAHLSDIAAANEAPSLTAAPLAMSSAPVNVNEHGSRGPLFIRTDTSAQIRSRLAGTSDGSTIIRIATSGWIDRRGRDA